MIMSKMRKTLRTKLRSAFSKPRREKVNVGGNGFSSKSSVNEEYMEVFRTKSYVEMWDRVHEQLPSTSTSTSRLSSSSSSLPPNMLLDRSEYLLEPRQETLKNIIDEEGLNLHHLLTDYFEASLDACHICDVLLRSIHQTRAENRHTKKLILKLSQRVHLLYNYYIDITDDEQCLKIFGELGTFALAKNPLSIISPGPFCYIHDSYVALFDRLILKHKKVRRASKRNRISKKVGGVCLVAPALMACSLGLCVRKVDSAAEWLKTRFPESHGQQLDMAAKGVYVLINDFDTISRMVRRLHDEVEHRKAVAGMCVSSVRNIISTNNGGSSSNCDIFKKVVREFYASEDSFVEQLEELEEHIYLCLLTINRSRRLVIQEILAST